jgi:beta-glucosidase
LHRVTPFDGIAAQAGDGVTLRHAVGADNHRWVPLLAEPMEVSFFNSTDLSGPEVLRKTYPRTEQMWAGAVEPGVSSDAFSARATVAYTVPEDGTYQISLVSAGLSRCLLDGELVVDAWSGWTQGETYFTFGCDEVVATRTLRAGQRCVFTLEFSSASPNPAPFRALRFGVHRPRGEVDIAAAVEAARGADTALVFIGLNGEWDNEGLDRPDLELPHLQNELVRRVAAANPNTIVVLQTGAPVTMPWLAEVPAVLQAWYPGQECGHAIADVLFGAADPGGRLPQTFPQRLADDPTHGNPLHYPGVDGRVVYGEGVFIGYRHVDRAGTTPLFAFGHGLSYTRFEHGALTLSTTALTPGGTLQVALDVKNTGARRGHEVVQLYVHDRRASVARPQQELKAFAKVELTPGESRRVQLTLDMRSFAFFDDTRAAWVAEAGEFEVRVGASSVDIRQRATLSLTADWVQAV